jgi:5'-methylthioadenosine phosphorylase
VSVHPASEAARAQIVLGVIGGSGLYEIEGFENVESIRLETPFGDPSGPYRVGTMARGSGEPVKVVFVPRHGPGHKLLPGEINYRANIHGLKQLGVTHLLSVSAVGSLREAIEPGHLVVPDQFIDRTKHRETTFFGAGAVAHVQFGQPTDAALRGRVLEALRAQSTLEGKVHDGGTCVVMEGPAFSTRAESELYRSWGADLIGMTALPEAKLAREAEMAYALLAMSTDYDCWHEEEVTVEAVMAVMAANVAVAKATIRSVAGALPVTTAELPYPKALENAVMTAPNAIPAVTRARLDLIIGHYLSRGIS